MGRALSLSAVDQSPVREGGSAAEALCETLELAVTVEALGYRRFWVAEHHNLPGFAGTTPEVLVGQIAARTRHIRVGSGGVMLSHYSALKVAETFRVLTALYPDRIDLGLGRAPGSDRRTAAALAFPGRVRDVGAYPEQVDDLLRLLEDGFEPGHRFAGIRAAPTAGPAPAVWLLGSGIDSALLAAERGLPFSYAHFFGIQTEQGPAIVRAYRDHFRPSRHSRAPHVNVTAQVVCAEEEDEARRLAASLGLARLRLALGTPGALAPPETALARSYTPEERAFIERQATSNVVGNPRTVRRGLEALADRYETDDLGIVTICHDFKARLRSYELVAAEFGLQPPAARDRDGG